MVTFQKKIIFLLLCVISYGSVAAEEDTRRIIIHRPSSRPQQVVYYSRPRPERITWVLRPHEAMIVLGTAVVGLLLVYLLTRNADDTYEDTHYYPSHHNDQVIVVHDNQPDIIIIDDRPDVIIIEEDRPDIIIVEDDYYGDDDIIIID